MEENIATNIDLCSTLPNLDQPCTDSLIPPPHVISGQTLLKCYRKITQWAIMALRESLFNFYKS